MTVEALKEETEKRYTKIMSDIDGSQKCLDDPYLSRFWEGKVSVLTEYKEFVEMIRKAINQP